MWEKVEAALNQIRPSLMADGGGVELMDVAGLVPGAHKGKGWLKCQRGTLPAVPVAEWRRSSLMSHLAGCSADGLWSLTGKV